MDKIVFLFGTGELISNNGENCLPLWIILTLYVHLIKFLYIDTGGYRISL